MFIFQGYSCQFPLPVAGRQFEHETLNPKLVTNPSQQIVVLEL